MVCRYGMVSAVLLAGLTIALTGCENEPTEMEDYQPEPMLHAYITTGQPFNSSKVWLEWIANDIETFYDPVDNGIIGADVVIYPVRDDLTGTDLDSSGRAVYYNGDPGYAGRYLTAGTDTVQANWRYRIVVTKSDEVDIWAETTAPDTFTLRVPNYVSSIELVIDVEPVIDPATGLPDTSRIPTLTRNDPSIRIKWSDAFTDVGYYDESKGGYFGTITALTDTADLEPLDPGWDPDDPDDALDPEDMMRAGFTFTPDYQNEMDLVWLFFNWAGPQRLEWEAASKEYYRYVLTSIMFQGGADVPRLESNVNGGLGCFGATYRHFFYINLVRVPG